MLGADHHHTQFSTVSKYIFDSRSSKSLHIPSMNICETEFTAENRKKNWLTKI